MNEEATEECIRELQQEVDGLEARIRAIETVLKRMNHANL